MGGKSSSKSSTQETTISTDKRMVVDGGSVGVSSDQSTVYVNELDGESISKAFEFAGASGALVAGSLDKVLKLADTVLTGSLTANENSSALMAQAFETAKTTESGSIDQKTMMVLAGVAAVAVVAYSKRAK